jgi:hypothetical protein
MLVQYRRLLSLPTHFFFYCIFKERLASTASLYLFTPTYFFIFIFFLLMCRSLASTASLYLLTPLAFTSLIPSNVFFYFYFFSCDVQERLAPTASLYLLTPLAFTHWSLPTFFFLFFSFWCAGAPSGDSVSSSAHNPLLQPYPLPPSGHAQGASSAVSLNTALIEP